MSFSELETSQQIKIKTFSDCKIVGRAEEVLSQERQLFSAEIGVVEDGRIGDSDLDVAAEFGSGARDRFVELV